MPGGLPVTALACYMPGPREILILGGCFFFLFFLLVSVVALVAVLVVKSNRPRSSPPGEGSEAKSPADRRSEPE